MSGVALLVLARCAGFTFRAPGFSHPSVPAPVRAGLALVLALLLAPVVHARAVPRDAMLAFAVAAELGVGAAIGTGASILYDGAYAGGRALDDYAGIRGSVPGASLYAASGFGRVWSLVFTAAFFLLGGYRLCIAAMVQSFAQLPPGSAVSMHGLYAYAIGLPAAIVSAALLVAGPAIALMFVGQVALGALARVIPRFAAFSLSFAVVFALALLATIAAVPALLPAGASPWFFAPFLPR